MESEKQQTLQEVGPEDVKNTVTRAFLQTGAYRLRIHFLGGFPTSIAAP